MFTCRPVGLSGVIEVVPRRFLDERGLFVKTYHRDLFLKEGLGIDWVEEYYSYSHAGVLRGLHFQRPPCDHAKLVYCAVGEVFDVVVDLRRGSPTFGAHCSVTLSAATANMLYIPSGFAHGFYAVTDALMMYKVSTVYSPECDDGIRWDSIGCSWLSSAPILSERDRGFSTLERFDSPFIYRDGHDTP